MDFLIIVFAGLLGTFLMTLFAELMCRMLQKPYHVVVTLSTMLEFKRPTPKVPKSTFYILGMVVHYGIGVIFSWIYFTLVTNHSIPFTLLGAIFYGCAIGFIAIAGWRMFFALHPSPPDYSLPQYLSMIWFGHVILSVTMFLIFQFDYSLS